MKKLFAALLAIYTSVAFGTTTVPVQLLNPTGSTAGQMLVSNGASSAPGWSNGPTITGGTINNATVGLTTPLAGKFTTLQATSTITPSSTAGIVGTATNDNANAGSVGEYVTATGTAVSLTTSTSATITSISLTAGDWDVWGNIYFTPASTTVLTSAGSGISTTAATLPAIPGYTFMQSPSAGANQPIATVAPMVRISVASSTTVYLIGFAAFSPSTCTATGTISARRVR